MSTGLETWKQNIPEQVGALYPGAGGIEVPLAIVGIASWVLWHVIQIRRENQAFRDDIERVLNTEAKMEEALELSEAGTIVQSVADKEHQLEHFSHNAQKAETSAPAGAA